MAWTDRIQEAAITSPSGKRFTYTYENVAREFDKKGSAYNFPDADGTYIQGLGNTGRRYPMRLIIWGDNYDLEATAFEALLGEPGVFKLEHPIYGVHNVVPLGKITRRDGLKDQGNQAILEFTFWETTVDIYPTSQAAPASDVATTIEEYNAAMSEQFEAQTSLGSAVEQSSASVAIDALNRNVQQKLKPIADTQANVKAQFDDISDSLNASVQTLIGDPLTLAFQTVLLIQAPARAANSITDRIEAYGNLLLEIVDAPRSPYSPGYDSRAANSFQIDDLQASSYVSGSILAALNNEFASKPQAIEAAESIASQFDSLVAWRDLNYGALGLIDTGAAYQKIQEAVAAATAYLVQLSFSLKQERTVVVDRDRTIVDLCAELYKDVGDDTLNLIINSNGLTGSEILEIPRGRGVLYYV